MLGSLSSPKTDDDPRASPGAQLGPTPRDLALQGDLLPGVSRTFALTIPELPAALRGVVTNAYLLCRIADTVEDEPALDPATRSAFHRQFARAVAGEGGAEAFARELAPRLSASTLPAERVLVENAGEIVRITQTFNVAQRAALARCIRIMCEGMSRFHDGREGRGLKDLNELRSYCYVVAGVVGEMLTDLFCDYAPAIAARRDDLQRFAVRFGEGLQLTNILKDIWEDLDRGYCWLPREHFQKHGFDLGDLAPGRYSPKFGAGLGEILGEAHADLADALEYTLAIPRSEKRIRHFCLWAVGMAVLTLRKIDAHRDFACARDVKISRRAVKAVIAGANLSTGNDRLLRILFNMLASRLPSRVSIPAGT